MHELPRDVEAVDERADAPRPAVPHPAARLVDHGQLVVDPLVATTLAVPHVLQRGAHGPLWRHAENERDVRPLVAPLSAGIGHVRVDDEPLAGGLRRRDLGAVGVALREGRVRPGRRLRHRLVEREDGLADPGAPVVSLDHEAVLPTLRRHRPALGLGGGEQSRLRDGHHE